MQVVDPNLKEEEVMGGRITITMNSQGDVCAVQKGGGVGVSSSEIMRCLRIAAAKAQSITETLKKAVRYTNFNPSAYLLSLSAFADERYYRSRQIFKLRINIIILL